jgi:hypothetical protein
MRDETNDSFDHFDHLSAWTLLSDAVRGSLFGRGQGRVALQTNLYGFSRISTVSELPAQDDSFMLPSITLPVLASPSLEHSLDEHVFYYFTQMRSLHPILVGNGLADVTYSIRAYAGSD